MARVYALVALLDKEEGLSGVYTRRVLALFPTREAAVAGLPSIASGLDRQADGSWRGETARVVVLPIALGVSLNAGPAGVVSLAGV